MGEVKLLKRQTKHVLENLISDILQKKSFFLYLLGYCFKKMQLEIGFIEEIRTT